MRTDTAKALVQKIFALSTYSSSHHGVCSKPPTGFKSALSIDWQSEAGCDAARIHIVWSASKDFGINGLRVGTIVSQDNAELLRALKATAKLYMISSPADALFCALINNRNVYADFIRTNRARMTQAYDVVVRWCAHHRIPLVHCSAGHFILVDLAQFMPDHVDGAPLKDLAAREGALWTHFLSHGVCLTPGSNYHCSRFGTFRLTFTLRRPALLEGLARIENALRLSPWPYRLEKLNEVEARMESISITPPAAINEEADDQHDPAFAIRAQDERRHYVNNVRDVLKQGGGSEALLSCGMGMNCSTCA